MTATTNPADDACETDDIYLGAYFLQCGCQMESKRKVGNKVLFKFVNKAGSMSDLRQEFYLGATGKLHAYAQAVICMKQLLF